MADERRALKQKGRRRDDDNGWHLDKRVPLALIIVLLAQAFGFGFWGATMQERIVRNAEALANLGEVRERLLVVETVLHRIEANLDRQQDRYRLQEYRAGPEPLP